MTNRKIEYWVIPPKSDGEFVAHMEEVLETYEKPYNPACPVVCMDEQPVQLLKETRTPIPATAQHGKRVDYEYERAGTANIFMFTEPLAGWREVAVRETKTKLDWATEMARLLEGRYADCERIILVCDNLNTHTKGAFYETFAPARARKLVRRIEFCYTPKHGSWLNIAENELSSVTRQCVSDRQFGDVETLRDRRTAAWSTDVNDNQCGVDWQMKINDARCKLRVDLSQKLSCDKALGDFSNQADAYRRSRPTYRKALVDLLIEDANVATGDAVADFGAGTGIFTRLLVEQRGSVSRPSNRMPRCGSRTMCRPLAGSMAPLNPAGWATLRSDGRSRHRLSIGPIRNEAFLRFDECFSPDACSPCCGTTEPIEKVKS